MMKKADYTPHENEYLRKKRIEREKTFFNRKNIYRLMLASILFCGAFVIWAEQTGFEGNSLFITALGFFMMFMMVVGLAFLAVIGLLVVRRFRAKPHSVFLDDQMHMEKNSSSKHGSPADALSESDSEKAVSLKNK